MNNSIRNANGFGMVKGIYNRRGKSLFSSGLLAAQNPCVKSNLLQAVNCKKKLENRQVAQKITCHNP